MASAYRNFVQPVPYSLNQINRAQWDNIERSGRHPEGDLASVISSTVRSFGYQHKADNSDMELEVVGARWNGLSVFLDEFADNRPANRDDPHYDAIEDHVAELEREATNESEMFNLQSAEHLRQFCHDLAATICPSIACMTNGNLRAVWQDRRKDQIGIQFMPDGQLQFVILRDRRGRTYKTLGVEDAATIERLVRALRLTHLWFNG